MTKHSVRLAPHGGFLFFIGVGYIISETLYGTVVAATLWGLLNSLRMSYETLKENK